MNLIVIIVGMALFFACLFIAAVIWSKYDPEGFKEGDPKVFWPIYLCVALFVLLIGARTGCF
jgi:hypothetical protein